MSRLIKDHHLWTRDTIKNVSGNVTLDIASDLILDPNSGVTKFYLAGSTTDYASLTVAANGVTTITTIDDGVGAAGHLTLDVDGDVILDPLSGITKFYKNGDTDDLCTLTVGLNGVTTIATADSDGAVGHLTLDVDGDINLKPNGNDVYINDVADTGENIFRFNVANSYMQIYDDSDVANFFQISVANEGATTISTVDDGSAVGHLTLDPDGELNLTPVTEVKSDAPLKIKEAANAVADTAAYGQVWVKNETPSELYFTTDAGDDIQLTDGTSAAGGGGGGDTNTFYMGPFGGRIGSVDNDTNFWTCGTYGVNYSFWTSENQLADRDHGASDTNEYQMAMRVVHIPYACTLKGFSGTYYSGAASTAYLIEWWKSTPTYPTATVSDLVFTDISINTTTPASGGYTMNQFSKTDGSVSLSAGDVLVPYISRASGSNSSYVYLMMNLIFEKS